VATISVSDLYYQVSGRHSRAAFALQKQCRRLARSLDPRWFPPI